VKQGLTPGIQRETSYEVTEAMCPIFEGRLVHRVCATWTIVHYMELAGRLILIDYLGPDEEGVGSHVTCDHLGPAPVGRTVRVEATARDVSERELVCDVVATVDSHVVAMGRTVQKVFPRDVLKRILKEP
jgi:predicted thioesterase